MFNKKNLLLCGVMMSAMMTTASWSMDGHGVGGGGAGAASGDSAAAPTRESITARLAALKTAVDSTRAGAHVPEGQGLAGHLLGDLPATGHRVRGEIAADFRGLDELMRGVEGVKETAVRLAQLSVAYTTQNLELEKSRRTVSIITTNLPAIHDRLKAAVAETTAVLDQEREQIELHKGLIAAAVAVAGTDVAARATN